MPCASPLQVNLDTVEVHLNNKAKMIMFGGVLRMNMANFFISPGSELWLYNVNIVDNWVWLGPRANKPLGNLTLINSSEMISFYN